MSLPEFSFWDILLLITVTLEAVLLAYISAPRWKAFFLGLPIPFSISFMAVGMPLDATNVTAVLLVFAYTHGVRILHYQLRLHILLSILLAAAAYSIIGAFLAGYMPRTEPVFWIAVGAAFITAVLGFRYTPDHVEPSHKTSIPLQIKIPLTFLLVLAIILSKKYLQGFMTAFPMLGVFGSYEGRKSLWTNCRQMPLLLVVFIPLMLTIRFLQPHLGQGFALLLGWIPVLIIVITIFINTKKKIAKESNHVFSRPV